MDVMGKVTTLKRAAIDTQIWLDAQARFMSAHILKQKKQLEKFTAYKLRLPNPMEHASPSGTLGGKIRLRSLVTIVHTLAKELEKFKWDE